jgi:predicted nucleic acid-binding protein
VKAFLDTSVLVAIFYGEHAHHEPSLDLFLKLSPKLGCCGAHSLAEVYSSLTRMPPPYRVRGDQALLFLTEIQARLSLVSLDSSEYFDAIKECALAGITGGTIYDGLLAQCALKAKAELIYTWNVRHYIQFGPEVEKRVRTP